MSAYTSLSMLQPHHLGKSESGLGVAGLDHICLAFYPNSYYLDIPQPGYSRYLPTDTPPQQYQSAAGY